jgi:hypothetical protein
MTDHNDIPSNIYQHLPTSTNMIYQHICCTSSAAFYHFCTNVSEGHSAVYQRPTGLAELRGGTFAFRWNPRLHLCCWNGPLAMELVSHLELFTDIYSICATLSDPICYIHIQFSTFLLNKYIYISNRVIFLALIIRSNTSCRLGDHPAAQRLRCCLCCPQYLGHRSISLAVW